MKGYIDLFLLPVLKKDLPGYCRMSRRAGKIMKELGLLEYREFLGDDLKPPGMTSFTSRIKLRRGEVLVSAVLAFRSKAHRNQFNKRIVNHPQMKLLFKEANENPIFEMKRMLYGGFSTIVDV